ncbi:hypothetical protein NQ315_009857 [Exocentrus adspersus]|uniref:Origin recognition complex subunit 6 n=1 Tax=Exocentrus adspersus TaxID=1586481 RepID=A0AAV8WIC7_9CUCU|nr:hypothetical protein NQ315_009857 [Exocentrus adspersus]
MSTAQNIKSISERLGIQDASTLMKAREFTRALHSKGSIKSLNDQAKTVLCLDLASSYSGVAFDKATAIKLSGLKKSVYLNSFHTVEKVLGLDKRLTISDLCVQLNCTAVKDLAEEVLSKYTDLKKISDVDHPQYVAGAVYAACRCKNLKIPRTELLNASHLKPLQLKELCNEFYRFTIDFGIGSSRKLNKDEMSRAVTDIASDIETKVALNKKSTDDVEVEDYEVWKRRILDAAYKALKNRLSDADL